MRASPPPRWIGESPSERVFDTSSRAALEDSHVRPNSRDVFCGGLGWTAECFAPSAARVGSLDNSEAATPIAWYAVFGYPLLMVGILLICLAGTRYALGPRTRRRPARADSGPSSPNAGDSPSATHQPLMTPFGIAKAVYPDRDSFYVANPPSARGWPQHGPGALDGRLLHPGAAPLGSDCQWIEGWLLTLVHDDGQSLAPTDTIVGDLVAFEQETGRVYLLEQLATWDQACARRIPSGT